MLRAKVMFLHAKVSPALAKSNFVAGGLGPVALRNSATDSSRTSLQPVCFPQVLILSKPEENFDRWRDKF